MVSTRESHTKISVRTGKKSAQIQKQQDDHDHLRNRLEFSPIVSRDHDTVLRCNETEAADDKLPGNDDNDDPGIQLPGLDKADQGRAYQQLVCQRIHEFSEVCHKVVLARQIAVKPVGNAGHRKMARQM